MGYCCTLHFWGKAHPSPSQHFLHVLQSSTQHEEELEKRLLEQMIEHLQVSEKQFREAIEKKVLVVYFL